MTTRILPVTTDSNTWLVSGGIDPVDVLGAGVDGATDDAGYIYATGAQLCVLSLDAAVLDPGYDTGFTMRLRARYSGAVLISIETGFKVVPEVTLLLYCGGTLIKTTTWSMTPDWTTYQVGLLPSEAALITDFTNLHLHVSRSSVGGPGCRARVSGVDIGFAEPQQLAAESSGIGRSTAFQAVHGRAPGFTALIGRA